MKSKKIIIIDIDGVLVPYPKYFEKYVFSLLNIKYKLDKIKQLPQYKLLKYSYRISNIKRTLPLLNNIAPSVIDRLKNLFNIWIVTTRPMDVSGADTIAWLKANKITYDELFFVNDKKRFIQTIEGNVAGLIEDEESNLIPFKDGKIKIAHIRRPGDWEKIREDFF